MVKPKVINEIAVLIQDISVRSCARFVRVKAVEDLLARVVENLIGRVSGPMKFRLIIQPLTAAVFAVRDGLKDAREERPPYLRALFTHPDLRSDMLKDGWKSVGKIFVIAIVIDLVE